jgi:hypothetical protein
MPSAALPQWIRPQLTQLVADAPAGDQWLHEIKYDGYRMHARLDHGAVRLLTRTGLGGFSRCQPSGSESSKFARLDRIISKHRRRALAASAPPLVLGPSIWVHRRRQHRGQPAAAGHLSGLARGQDER